MSVLTKQMDSWQAMSLTDHEHYTLVKTAEAVWCYTLILHWDLTK